MHDDLPKNNALFSSVTAALADAHSNKRTKSLISGINVVNYYRNYVF